MFGKNKGKDEELEVRDVNDLLKQIGFEGNILDPKKTSEESKTDSRKASYEELGEAFILLREKYNAAIKRLEQLASQPLGHATVIALKSDEKKSAIIIYEGRTLEVLLPEQKKIQPGDTVKILPQNFQIIDVTELPPIGSVAIVRRLVDSETSEVEHQGSIKVVLNGKCAGQQIEIGDRVRLDQSSAIILERLNKEEERYRFSEETNVSFDDIGGLDEAKELLIETIELPHKHPDLFSFYDKKPPKGILLYGPPGCGKTMLAKASAASLAKIYQKNGEQPSGFFYIRGPEILDRYVGASETTIRQIFGMARDHQKKSGYPAIIFIDEADAILNKRGSGISSDVERTIVPMFLAEMDGIQKSGAIVLLATNRQDTLDPAIIRDGRIDRKVKVTRPTRKVSAEIFKLYLKNIPFADKTISLKEIAEFATEELFSEKRVLYDVMLGENRKTEFTLANLVSGAMIKGIVDRTTSIALHRDLEIDAKSGIARDDIVEAIECSFRENFDMNHEDELEEFIREHGGGIPIKRLIQGKK